MKRKICLIFGLFMAVCFTAIAQSFRAEAPSQVAVGEQFRLTYTINTGDVNNFRAGNIPDALEVLVGPSTSRRSSVQIINGHTSQSSSVTFTYILCANKNGTFTIPAATITADGQKVTSNALKITVSGQAQGGGQSQRRQHNEPQMRAAGSAISGSDLFIKVSASKRRVVEQEPVLLTYKVYTLVDLTQLEGKMPDLKGFHTQEVTLPQQKSFKIEQLNGRNYRTVTWSQYVMFPQMTGKLTIPPITFNGIVVQQNRAVDPFEAFFNGGSGYVEVKKKIEAPGITLQVDPLPQRPAGFSGGVGQMKLSTSLDKPKVKAGDPITLRVVVSGVGNLKLLKEPVVNFPKDFDCYDAKLTDRTRLTSAGVEGSMVYDFLAVPRHQGKYDIPAVEFKYFDTEAHRYVTLTGEAFHLDVAHGNGNGGSAQTFGSQEDVQLLAKDIHHIKMGSTRQHATEEFFFGSTAYVVSLVALLVAFVSLLVIFRERAARNADVVGARRRKANKMAVKRMKVAARLMKENRRNDFYDEVLRALWGYVSHRLNMPVEQLSRENIAETLEQRQVGEEKIAQLLAVLDACEYERYAPGETQEDMQHTYENAISVIEAIEGELKRKGKDARKAMTLVLLLLMTATPVLAMTKAEADGAYNAGRYQQAIGGYEALLKQGVSADLYYNLGNAYYRTNHITQAVLNYERALLLSPADEDIRFNLALARSKTIDKITPESEMFFVTWYRSALNMASVDGWARTALIALGIAVMLALLYLFASVMWMRKVGFFGAAAMIVLFVLANVFAHAQKDALVNRTGAIITSSAVTVKSSPAATGTDLFILHEGTKVTITDRSMARWREVRVGDGKQGWVEKKVLEEI